MPTVVGARVDGRHHERDSLVSLRVWIPEVAEQSEEVTVRGLGFDLAPGKVETQPPKEGMMAISHADHDHPNTSAARAACRKALSKDGVYDWKASPERKLAEEAGIVKPATWHVKPKGKTPAAVKNMKRINTLIKNDSDMADVPRALAHGIREAWARDLDVKVGDRFRHDEARVVIQAELGEIALVWKDSNMHGVHAIWVRNWDSSKAFKVNSVAEAFTVTEDRDLWDEFGNLRTA